MLVVQQIRNISDTHFPPMHAPEARDGTEREAGKPLADWIMPIGVRLLRKNFVIMKQNGWTDMREMMDGDVSHSSDQWI
jgi:hypothetical protein